MAKSDDLYKGREQSLIKHFILQRYLTEMAFKIGQSNKNVLTPINYVDGLAGPWGTRDTDSYSDTSFRQAIDVLRTVRHEIHRLRNAKLPVRFVFCEQNKKTHAELVEAVSNDSDVEIHCLHGRFEKKLDEVSAICREGFTFTFIDPKGFKVYTNEISEFLRRHRGEFLWNYMADHANRFLEREGLEDAYGALLVDQKWQNRLNDPSLSGLKNEERVLAVLRERLKELGCADYVIDFPVMRPRENRIQFRLLFGTRSAAGVAVFRSAQKKAEEFQATKREEIRQEAKGFQLVSPELHAESFLARDGIDGSIAQGAAPSRIRAFLSANGPTRFHDMVAPILETERLTEPVLKDVLLRMRADLLIDFTLPLRKRKPQGDIKISLTA